MCFTSRIWVRAASNVPADFFINTQLGVVFSKATGECGMADALDHMNRLRVHPDFRPEMRQLMDLRDVTKIALTTQEIRELAEQTVFNSKSRRAFVVSTDLQYGLSRMFGIHREFIIGEHGVMVFREMDEALIWLGLSEEPDPKLFTELG